jgi:hypothetical protein
MDKCTLLKMKEKINNEYLRIENEIKNKDYTSAMFHKIELNGLVIAMNII